MKLLPISARIVTSAYVFAFVKLVKIISFVFSSLLILFAKLEETLSLSNLAKTPFVISGGISSISDVINIKKKNYSNIEGIIIGKAIYDGNINIKRLSEMI